MKKALSIVLILTVLLVFSGCSKSGSMPENLNLENFVSTVSFNEGENKISGIICCPEDQEVSFTVTEPENIKGIVFSVKGGETYVTYGGVQIPIENSGTLFESKKGIDNLFEIILSCFSNPPKKAINSQYKAKYSLGEAVITLDKSNHVASFRTEKYNYIFTGMSESA